MWPDDLTAELPAPRPDEPRSLRQEIADELADHLSCAYEQQLRQTSDPDQARQRVLERFGNPRQVARRLWFDAMKERIMAQRLTLVIVALLAGAAFASAGLTWIAVRDMQQTNRDILERLAEWGNKPSAVAYDSVTWNPVKVRLVQGDRNGPPIAGCRVSLQSYSQEISSTRLPAIDETTGEDGTADLGLVPFGSYTLVVSLPWGESAMRSLAVRPGRPVDKTIVCPSPPQKVPVRFEVVWPDDLRDRRWWVLLRIASRGRNFAGAQWAPPVVFSGTPIDCLVADDARVVPAGRAAFDPSSPAGAATDSESLYSLKFGSAGMDELLRPYGQAMAFPGGQRRVFSRLLPKDVQLVWKQADQRPAPAWPLPESRYELIEVVLLEPQQPDKPLAEGSTFLVRGAVNAYTVGENSSSDALQPAGLGAGLSTDVFRSDTLSNLVPPLELKADGPVTWRIDLTKLSAETLETLRRGE